MDPETGTSKKYRNIWKKYLQKGWLHDILSERLRESTEELKQKRKGTEKSAWQSKTGLVSLLSTSREGNTSDEGADLENWIECRTWKQRALSWFIEMSLIK